MSAVGKAIWLVLMPFRIAWIGMKAVWILVSCVLCLWLGSFIAYWIALAFSYIFLPETWTASMWAWSSGLYDNHLWFRIATIAPFTFLVALPFAFLKDDRTPEERRREEEEQNRQQSDALIAARQQEEARQAQWAAQELSRLQAHKSLFG